MADKSVFKTLSEINVNEKVETKNNLTYLSWVWAWGELKKLYPDSISHVYENEKGWNYFTDGKTGWVKTGVTVQGLEHIEYLPIMDFRNKSIPLDNITSFDVNKTLQRSITKAIARHGLGIYIYAGEDLPESSENENIQTKTTQKETPKQTSKKTDKPNVDKWLSENQFEKLKQNTKEEIKKYLAIYNGTTAHTDGKIYGMKGEYREALNKLI